MDPTDSDPRVAPLSEPAPLSGPGPALQFRCPVTPALRALLGQVVSRFRSLADVVGWAGRRARPAGIHEVVAQDAYSHDVIVPLPEGVVLVLDVRAPGGLVGAAVWDHLPTPFELLMDRLDRGWSPRGCPGGPVQGYASWLPGQGN